MIPQVFVVAPKQFVDRRNAAEGHLKALGITPTLFSGLCGRDISLMSYKARIISYRGQNDTLLSLNENQIALALNHWFLWSHIVLSKIPQALIFEDDILLPDNFEQVFADSMANTPPDWEFVYLSTLYPERIDDGRIMTERVGGNIVKHKGARTWDGACDGTHSYMITLEGAMKMVDIPFTIDEHIDRWISFHILPRLNTYIWHPSPVKQRSGLGQWSSTT
jgi:glycosyl transferase family 25